MSQPPNKTRPKINGTKRGQTFPKRKSSSCPTINFQVCHICDFQEGYTVFCVYYGWWKKSQITTWDGAKALYMGKTTYQPQLVGRSSSINSTSHQLRRPMAVSSCQLFLTAEIAGQNSQFIQPHRIHGTGICIYIHHKFKPNVGKYAIHGSYGN